MTRIIQISDPHIVPNGQLAYGEVDTAVALASCVETIDRLLSEIGSVDLVIVTGDITDFGTKEEYQRFREIMGHLSLPYRVIPGNHDNIENMRACFSDQPWMSSEGPINWTFKFNDMILIALDSSIADCAHGNLSENTLSFLSDTLELQNGLPALVAIHHPPVMIGIEKMDTQNLRESAKLHSILSSYSGEKRLICGHVHRNIVASFGSFICQIAPGVSHAVSMDLRPGAPNCFTKEPGGFLLHEVRSGFVTHHIPTGKFAGPFLFYP